MSDARHLVVNGDLVGEYIVDEELPDGRLVIKPEPYPSAFPRPEGRLLIDDEFAAFLDEHRDLMPADGEG